MADGIDVIHHVTFNGFRFPGAWWACREPVVLGPLGGGSITATQFRRCFGTRWAGERVREFSVKLWRLNPWTVASLKRARAVMVVGEDLRKRFRSAGIDSKMMLETALPLGLEKEPGDLPADQKKDFLWVGNLEPWKAWQIALEAFAVAKTQGLGSARLRIIGRGRQAAAAQERAMELGIGESVDFLEQLTQEQVWELMARARALVFSSVRDTSGNVVLEAMGLRCPVICFDHQGVGMMTDDLCAVRIQPTEWEECVRGFASAMVMLAKDNKRVSSMGAAGRTRALREFTWDAKVTEMLELYSLVHEA